MSIKTVHYCSNPASFPLKQNINNGITNSKGGMPQKFRGADGGASFAMGRSLYANRSRLPTTSLEELYRIQKMNNINGFYVTGKPINIQSSDQYIQRKKNLAIGKGSMPGFNNGSTDLSFKSNKNSNINTSNDARRRCRSGGCVAPKKKGARPTCN